MFQLLEAMKKAGLVTEEQAKRAERAKLEESSKDKIPIKVTGAHSKSSTSNHIAVKKEIHDSLNDRL